MYNDKIRKIILDYKFNEKPYLYNTFSTFIKNNILFDNYDLVIPVPISINRYKTRGYNQSYLIAKNIAKNLNLKVKNNILYKTKNNNMQSSLDKGRREENVKGVYQIRNKNEIINKKILLIDDIFTTGATANECSRVLKENGASCIDVFTIAKD